MGSGAGHPDPGSGPPHITPELLADLQAGLLDDATAARVRRHARTDPEAARVLAGLDAVRRRLAELGTDDGSAPEVPVEVTAAVAEALRTAPRAASPEGGGHALARPRLSRVQWAGLVVGVCAVAAAAVLGVLTLTGDPGPAFPPGPTAEQITVERPAGFPLTDEELRDALTQPAEIGPLADPQRRASCLTGLGHSPTEEVLGGRLLEVSGRPGVLLLLPDGTSEQLSAVVVEPTCSASHTGLLAETVLTQQ